MIVRPATFLGVDFLLGTCATGDATDVALFARKVLFLDPHSWSGSLLQIVLGDGWEHLQSSTSNSAHKIDNRRGS